MKEFIIALLVTILFFLFGTKPLLQALGGSAKLITLVIINLAVGILVFALLKVW